MTMKKTVLLLLTAFAAACIMLSSCGGARVGQTAASDRTVTGGISGSTSENNGSGGNGSTREYAAEAADRGEAPLVSLLQNTVDVLTVKEYSGRFIEKGRVETAKNVLCVTLKNNGADDIRLLDFEVSDGAKTYAFSVTTLLSGDIVTVAEKNGETVRRDFKAKSIKVTRTEYFDIKPSMNADVFELDCSDGVINVKNISDSDISDGYIYYKEFSDGGYFGGITYRIRTGGIKSGEAKRLSVSGFTAEEHRAVFTTYVR